jgi:hypothetical protein
MRAQVIQVQLFNEDGTHCRWMSQGEADRMFSNGEVTRVSGRRDAQQKFKKRFFPQASEAKPSAASITIHDTRAIAGMTKVNEIWIERLIGFNLLPEGTMVPASGYLA